MLVPSLTNYRPWPPGVVASPKSVPPPGGMPVPSGVFGRNWLPEGVVSTALPSLAGARFIARGEMGNTTP